uniref:N/A n=1 Tax=Ganoderma boninense TaxID=34458 RepID=A0A5K1K4G3_9APHY|nr:N/A [Ganoderma boninense]
MGNIAGYPFPAYVSPPPGPSSLPPSFPQAVLTKRGRLTSALTCRFLLDLHQADRTTRAPSSLSAMPSLDFGAVSELEANNPDRETLPAFIASMGEPVYMGSHFADFAGEEDDVAHTNGAGSRRLGEHDFAENPGDE